MNQLRSFCICSLLVLSQTSCSGPQKAMVPAEAKSQSNPNLVQSENLDIRVSRQVKNLILMIPDGFGPASLTAARLFKGSPLILDSIVTGVVQTQASDSEVTDSAASATAYATGIRTYNGAIGVNDQKESIATILEAAQAKGMKTGLVATSRITHATPASFAAHVPSRSMEEEIAQQVLEHKVDVILGGGIEFFRPLNSQGRRKDNRNLIEESKTNGYMFVETASELGSIDSSPVLGLFSTSHMAYEIDRERTKQPSIAEMTKKAIELLSDSKEGFFLMVEGSRIDHAGHGNDIGAHLGDILAFDDAVGVAKNFASQNDETLLISVADHETGGLSVARKVGPTDFYEWRPEVAKEIKASIEFINAEGRRRGNIDSVWVAETGWTLSDEEQSRISEASAPGGRGVGRVMADIMAERTLTGWTTNGHTGVDVNLAAFGAGSARFKGSMRNDVLGQQLEKVMEFDLEALTRQLRNQ